ncbi:unnamed protein product [Caenorhabditis sp. 36 PRJEB53466]|nr:unnamed protein product [Caenorhabditis sp. 36 PRJEB53466]
MSETQPNEQTPQRMSTRTQPRVNYNELISPQNSLSDGIFRSPTASTRGRKKRPVPIEVMSDLSSSFGAMYNTPPKRGRPRGAGFVGSVRGRGPTTRRATTEDSLDSENHLVIAVKTGKRIPETVDAWIERYNELSTGALAEIQQFFFTISGCKGHVTPQMSMGLSYKEIVSRMTEEFEDDSADYPMIQGGPMKKFRTNLHTFLHTLVNHVKSTLIFDHVLMDSFVQLLTGMADSQVRAFRHTATFCAVKLSSALVDVTIELTESRVKTIKQIEAEKQKIKNNATGNEKYEALVAQKSQTEERIEEVREILGYFFRSVFVHRYRDTVPDIRCICITELGHWLDIYPEHFIEDSYLKYLGWNLFDKAGEVRLRCVRALIPIFEKRSMPEKMELFVNKFKDRLVSMVLDKDVDTSVETCHLLRVMYNVFPLLLNQEDCVPIYELIYSTNRQLAMAAGSFINNKIFMNAEHPTKQAIPRNVQPIIDLVTFFIEGECHDHAAYLVDALIDVSKIAKDWATMVELLLNDKSPLNPLHETKLIDILACSVEQAATGEQPVGRATTKRGMVSHREQREIEEEKARLTDILIPILPRLLNKFGSDNDKAQWLASLPKHFNLSVYATARNQAHFTELIETIDTLIERHVDEDVLQELAGVYNALSNHRTTGPMVEAHKMKMLDGIAAFLRNSFQQFEDEAMGEEEEAQFVAYMRRMSAFSGFINLRHWDLWEMFVKVVSNYDREETKRDVREYAVGMMHVQVVYDFIELKTEGEAVKRDQVLKLRNRRDQLIDILAETIDESAYGVEQAYLCICDLMVFFNHLDDVKALDPLRLELDDIVIANLKMFLRINVFENNETEEKDQTKRIEMMYKMRHLVAQFVKLIVHGCLGLSHAAELMRYYQTHYQQFGDLFKTLLAKCREMDFIATGLMTVETLESLFFEIERTSQKDPNSDEFNQIRDLAKRLSHVFGHDYAKNRFAVAALHKKAIDYAFQDFSKETDSEPKNIYFLEVAMEFSALLLNQDKVAIHRYLLKKYVEKGGSNEWEPFRLYSVSLTDRSTVDDDDAQSVRSERTNVTIRSSSSSIRGRGRGRRQRVYDD